MAFGACDAIVLAGTYDSLFVEVGGNPVAKPFLELGGLPLVVRTVDALLRAEGIREVFVVGERAALDEALECRAGQAAGRLHVMQQAQGILDNAYRAFFHGVLPSRGFPAPPADRFEPGPVGEYLQSHPEAAGVPALFLTADLPFISPQDIEQFLRAVPERAALAVGVVDWSLLARHFEELGVGPEQLFRWKLGGIPLRGLKIRITNVFFARPASADPRLYGLLDRVYGNRWLLDERGKPRAANWKRITSAVLSHSRVVNPWWRHARAVVNVVPTALAGLIARALDGGCAPLAWPARLLLGKKDVEFTASLLLGVEAVMVQTASWGAAVDVDVEQTYRFLAGDGERAWRQLSAELESPAPAAGEMT